MDQKTAPAPSGWPSLPEQEFLFEGRHLLEEALACDWPLEAVCYTEDWFRSHGALVARVPKPVERRLVADHVLRSLATTDHPKGSSAWPR